MPSNERVELENMTDEQLISCFQKGDEDAYVLIVERYKDKLLNFVYRYLGSYDDSEDIVQEALIKVYINKHLYREIAKFSTWIYTIAINLARTKLAKNKKYNTLSLSNVHESDDDFDIPDTAFLPDTNADSKIQSKFIQDALNQLPENYRKLIVLRDIHDFSYEEIADMEGLPMGTVKSRINRGREKLQELLKDIYKQ